MERELDLEFLENPGFLAYLVPLAALVLPVCLGLLGEQHRSRCHWGPKSPDK